MSKQWENVRHEKKGCKTIVSIFSAITVFAIKVGASVLLL
jgi:hypothetical protein